VIPRFAEQTDLQVIEMAVGDPPEKPASATALDAVLDGLRADTSLSWFDCDFADWYWTLMSAA
jgi:hypothetical protein